MRAIRFLLVAAIACALVPVSGAAAQPGSTDGNERIVISGPVVVNEGETVDDVVVFHGSAEVAGRVNGDLVVFDGPVDVSGMVDGDLVAFRGSVTLRETADIRGDVVVPGSLNMMPGARIAGERKEAAFRDFPERFAFFGRIAMWIGFTVAVFALGLLILLLGPKASERLTATGLGKTAPAMGWGLVAFFALPILTLVLFITLVGIPLGIMLLFGLFFFYPVAYATSALVAGRKIVGGPGKRFVSFFAGLAILRILALVPVLGGLTSFLAMAFGLGVIAMAIARARSTPVEPEPAPVAAP